jgi:histidyl-tRNA synthetase
VDKPPLTPPSGSRDFLPPEMRRREAVIGRIKSVFSLHGYEPMDTPAFERLEVLAGKYGDEGDKLIFKILKRGEKAASGEADMALRYDLTVPAVRLYAHRRGELARVFKRYQIGPVWRADRPGKGRFREFYQCDVDIFGSASSLADVDVIVALSAALAAVGLPRFEIRLNSRRVLHAMMDSYGVAEADHGSALIALDKIDKIGLDGVKAELGERGFDAKVVDALCGDIARDNFQAVLRNRLATSETGQAGLGEVDAILQHATPRLGEATIRFDPILARGLDYYTGAIYEFVADGAGGSIAGGGRYDDLAGMFLKESVPVCGGSLGIERILLLLDEDAGSDPAPRAYVTVWDDAATDGALILADALRAAGIAAEVDLTGAKIGRQFKTADERGCRFTLVMGPDEQDAGTVMIKDLTTGEQQAVALDQAVAHIQRLLSK